MHELLILNKEYIIIAHVLSVVVGMGGAIITDVLFVYFAFNKKLSFFEIKTMRLLSKIVMCALLFIVVTGIFVFFTNTEKYLNSAKFLTKMTVVTILSVNGVLLHFLVFRHLKDRDYLIGLKNKNLRKLAFAFGAISVVSWLTAMSLGVLDKITITYTQAISIYLFVLSIAIMMSQIIHQYYETKK